MNERLGEGRSEESPSPPNLPFPIPKTFGWWGGRPAGVPVGWAFFGKQYGGKFNLFAVFFEMSRFMGKWKCVAVFLLSVKRGSHRCYGFSWKMVSRPQVKLRVPLPDKHVEA